MEEAKKREIQEKMIKEYEAEEERKRLHKEKLTRFEIERK